jgi:hypothetical protein
VQEGDSEQRSAAAIRPDNHQAQVAVAQNAQAPSAPTWVSPGLPAAAAVSAKQTELYRRNASLFKRSDFAGRLRSQPGGLLPHRRKRNSPSSIHRSTGENAAAASLDEAARKTQCYRTFLSPGGDR